MKKFLKTLVLSGIVMFFCSCGKDPEPVDPFEPIFSVQENVNQANTAGSGAITVEASDDVTWSASVPSGNDWITLTTKSGKGNGSVEFTVSENDKTGERSVEVNFLASSDRTKQDLPSQKCVVKQIGSAPAILIDPSGTATVPVAANENYAITVTSNTTWTVSVEITSGPEGWITKTAPEASVNGEGEVILSILANTDTETREAVVTVVSTTDAELSQTLTITQNGAEPVLEIDRNENAIVSVSANADYSIEVTSNVEWEASVEIKSGPEGWISVTNPTNAVKGDGTVVINILENDAFETRAAVVTVVSTADPNLKKTHEITQEAAAETFAILIPNYSLDAGTATMSISPYPTGTAQNLTVDVSADESGSTIEYDAQLPAGDYLINSLAYGANPAIIVDVVITINAVGETTFVEPWNEDFNCFGGASENRPIAIASSDNLIALRDAVNDGNNYSGVFFKQTNDIALSDEWAPIGNTTDNKFSGVYDGNNKKISNLNIASGTSKALFGFLGGVSADEIAIVAVVKNLTVEGAGGTEPDVTGDVNAIVAGIVANVTANSRIENCKNYANIKVTGSDNTGNIGGIAATCTGENINIEGCVNYGKITGNSGNNGGIVGNFIATTSLITNCHNHGDIENAATTLTSATGGIAGVINSASAEINRCSNSGKISITVAANRGLGGITGTINGAGSIVSECFNLGTIEGMNNMGGISGVMSGTGTSKISNCYNKGAVLFGNRTAVNNAGIAGNLSGNLASVIEYCYNIGTTVTPDEADRFGGVASANTPSADNFTGVKECFYESDLGYAGGIGGGFVPIDVTDKAEGKSATELKSATPYTANWDTSIWQFTAGQYPTLKNNPE